MEIDPVEHLSYHRWASQSLLDAAAALESETLFRDWGASHHSIFGTLTHIFQADLNWLSRLTGGPAYVAPAVVPEQGIAFLQRDWPPRLDAFVDWAQAFRPEDFSRPVTYLHSSGRQFSDVPSEIVLHVVNHGTLHRGQVMAMFRQAGVKPPSTDLISYYRLGKPR